jgi:hypothetical protein
MKNTGLTGTLFAGILVTITLLANAREGIDNGTGHYVLQRDENHQVMTQAPHDDRNSHGSPERDVLDLVFVASSALLGLLLLRKVNNS